MSSPVVGQTINWTGAGTNDNWFTAANWDLGVPGATNDVIITGNSPVNLNGNALIQSLNLSSDVVLNIQTSRSLDFSGTAGMSLTNAGTINQVSNTDLQFWGSVLNSGNINVAGGSNAAADIQIEDNVTLTGGGTVLLGGTVGSARIQDETGTADGVLTNVDNTIRGQGQIGVNRTQIINSGLIDANQNGMLLTLDPIDAGSQFTNTGILRATNGGILALSGNGGGKFLNANGTMEAQSGSTVRLINSAAIVGGTLQSTDSGKFEVAAFSNSEFENVTFASGRLDVLNAANLKLTGTFNNGGVVNLTGVSNAPADIQIEDNVTLVGGGNIVLGGVAGSSRILDEAGTADGVLTNVDNTIQGYGQIGFNRMGLVNQVGGTISANVANQTLTIDLPGTQTASPWTNDGTLTAANEGKLSIQQNLVNNGLVFAQTDSLIQVGSYPPTNLGTQSLVNNGTIDTQSGGRVQTETLVNYGLLSGNGELYVGDAYNYGLLSPGNSVGHLDLISASNFVLDSSSQALFEIEGAGLGQYDTLNFTPESILTDPIIGRLILGGELLVDLNGYVPTSTDTFSIITAQRLSDTTEPLTGFFDNVGQDGTLFTVGGEGYFTVHYDFTNAQPNVTLHSFVSAVPEPGSAGLLALALAGMGCIRRRR